MEILLSDKLGGGLCEQKFHYEISDGGSPEVSQCLINLVAVGFGQLHEFLTVWTSHASVTWCRPVAGTLGLLGELGCSRAFGPNERT